MATAGAEAGAELGGRISACGCGCGEQEGGQRGAERRALVSEESEGKVKEKRSSAPVVGKTDGEIVIF